MLSAYLCSRYIGPSEVQIPSIDPIQQIFTEELPFQSSGRRVGPGQIMKQVLDGKRPLRSSDVNGRISDSMWEIMQKCWAEGPNQRPTAESVLESFA